MTTEHEQAANHRINRCNTRDKETAKLIYAKRTKANIKEKSKRKWRVENANKTVKRHNYNIGETF